MLSILKKKSPHEQEAKALYAQCLATVRQPLFYERYGLPDTMEARFDLLVAHLYLLIGFNLQKNASVAESFNQALFDVLFVDMDQTLREMGIGDMGVPKRMRKMMTGFNGRMHRYDKAFAAYDANGDIQPLATCIALNIYASEEANNNAGALAEYFIKQRAHINKADSLDTDNLFIAG